MPHPTLQSNASVGFAAAVIALLVPLRLALARLPPPPATQTASQSPTTAPRSVDVNVTVDPRIELLLIVQHLTGDYEKRTNLITNLDFAYKREIEERFRPFAMHTVVPTYRAMALRGFSFDAGPQAVLRLTADESLGLRAAMPDDLLARVGGAEQFETFRSQLADFAQATGYFEFFRQHQPLYDDLCASVRESIKPGELVAALNDYTGMQVADAHLVLFPLGHSGGFAAEIALDDGSTEVFAVVGPGGAAEDRPTWATSPWMESLIIHEFAHTIVNPLADAHAERVARSEDRLKDIREQMSRQAYQSWNTVVNEHIVRALEVRIALKRHGMEAGTRKLNEDVKRGFKYLPALAQALDRFEKDRTRWPTLELYYPHLLEVFEREEADATPQTSPEE